MTPPRPFLRGVGSLLDLCPSRRPEPYRGPAYWRAVRRGRWVGFAGMVGAVVGGTALTLAGHDWAGGTMAVGAVVATLVAFVLGR